MARYVILRNMRNKPTIVKCDACKTMFVAEQNNHGWSEPCPYCHSHVYINWHRIPLWKYNLIKWFRGGFKDE